MIFLQLYHNLNTRNIYKEYKRAESRSIFTAPWYLNKKNISYVGCRTSKTEIGPTKIWWGTACCCFSIPSKKLEAWSLTKLIYPVLFTLYLVGQSSIKSLVIKTWYVIFDDSYLAAKKKVGEAKTDYFKDLCCCNYICFQKPSHQYCQSWNFNLLYRVCIQVQRYYNYIRLLPRYQ